MKCFTGKAGFVIGAVSSGSGKTTVTNGLLRSFRSMGLKAAPFKVGPDYIDTHFHKVASGRDSINLDVFMGGEHHVKGLFADYSRGCDVCVVEGVMGLFDGYDCRKGSAAHIAEILGLPVILLINAASSAYSLAAVLSGFRNFDPSVNIAGVIFNNVASDNHLRLLRNAARDSGVEFLGYVKRDSSLTVPSRHLGLTLDEDDVIDRFVANAAEAVSENVDISRILEVTGIKSSEHISRSVKPLPFCSSGKRKCRIAVAHDEAFNFIYPANLHALESNDVLGMGYGEIVRFSPLRDEEMPEADLLYLPGGYPELYRERLSANKGMRKSIREFIENGGYTIAECGGMLYLGDDIDGIEMCGILPLTGTMAGARLKLGYRSVRFQGCDIRGHEFHYSSVRENEPLRSIASQTDVRGEAVATPVYRYKNTIAGYTHLYWAESDFSKLWE